MEQLWGGVRIVMGFTPIAATPIAGIIGNRQVLNVGVVEAANAQDSAWIMWGTPWTAAITEAASAAHAQTVLAGVTCTETATAGDSVAASGFSMAVSIKEDANANDVLILAYGTVGGGVSRPTPLLNQTRYTQ